MKLSDDALYHEADRKKGGREEEGEEGRKWRGEEEWGETGRMGEG